MSVAICRLIGLGLTFCHHPCIINEIESISRNKANIRSQGPKINHRTNFQLDWTMFDILSSVMHI